VLAEAAPSFDAAALEQKIVALEARAVEQEEALRRVLTLLVDWVENGTPEPAYRAA